MGRYWLTLSDEEELEVLLVQKKVLRERAVSEDGGWSESQIVPKGDGDQSDDES